MSAEILVNTSLGESRVARLENGQLVEFHVERHRDKSYIGNIYLGRVSRVLPGMQAAFVEIGLARTAFLYVKNIIQPGVDYGTLDSEVEDSENSTENDTETEEEKNNGDSKFPDISTLITEGEKILVQVTKDPLGTKGARITGFVRVPGRYLVYMPEARSIGISRKITDEGERDRLKQIVEKNLPAQGGFIIRTVAEGASAKNLKDDMDYLIKVWGTIKKSVDKANAPSLIYSDLDLPLKTLRDRVTEDVERIQVDDLETYKKITKFVQNFLPRFKKRIEFYSEKLPLLESYGVEAELHRALKRRVWLKSGGSIIIDQTEAITSIDVNTGRFVGKSRNLEDTIFVTNMEALKEIAYQIRLRNIGGIIIVDFIDMNKEQNRTTVYQAFLEEIKKDPAKTQVLPISELGLIQMTRKRTQESLLQKLTAPCSYCEGKGYTRSRATIAYQVLREAAKEAHTNPAANTIVVYCQEDLAEYLSSEEKAALDEWENRHSKKLQIKVDTQLHLEEYEILPRE